MISLQKKEEGLITRYPIVGSRRLSNYWWSIVIFLGGCGFLFTGLSSFFDRNLLLLPSLEGVTKSPKLELATQLNKDKARELVVIPTLTLNPQGKGFPHETKDLLCKAEDLLTKSIDTLEESTKLEETTEQLLTLKEYKKRPFPRFITKPIRNDFLTKLSVSDRILRNPCYASFALLGKPIDFSIASIINTNFVGLPTASEAAIETPKGSGIHLISLFNQVPILPFFPQGLVLSFYGFLGVTFSFHLFFALFWEIGGGFNEINKKDKSVRIFRWGRPGKNRRIDLKYSNELMDAIKIELSPKPALFLCLKGDKQIPLTRIGELLPLEDLETQAAELTSLLQVPLEIVDS